MKIKIGGLLLALVISSVFIYFTSLYQTNFVDTTAIKNNALFSIAQDFNNRIYDAFFRNKNIQPKNPNAFLIAIDEDSVQEIGRWPWPRNVISTVLNEAVSYGVKSIGNDIIFSEAESEASDNQLAQVVEKYPQQITLGTFSDYNLTDTGVSYQDYCLNEAFLQTGGDQIVKLKLDLIVEDDSVQYEEADFNPYFTKVFNQIRKEAQQFFLFKHSKKSVEELNQFQKNNLNSSIRSHIYGYCQIWLTPEDHYYKEFESQLKPDLEFAFSKISQFKNLTFDQQIKKFKQDSSRTLIPHFAAWLSNIPQLQTVAQNTASFVVDPDEDGVVRKYPLIFRTGNKLGSSFIPSLALQTYLSATGYQAVFQITASKNQKIVNKVIIKDISGDKEKIITELPVDQNGRLIINYYGKLKSLPYISARDLFQTEEPQLEVKSKNENHKEDKIDFLKNKSAIFGATATAIYDIRNTPVQSKYPGPEIHLTVLQNLFDQSFIKVIDSEFKIFCFSVVIVALLFTGLFLFTNFIIPTIALLICNYGIYLILQNNFIHNIKFELVSILVIFTYSLYFFLFVYIYFFETRKSKELKNTFSKYVSKEIVEEILKNQENLELKGQKLTMTVFFSDIRSFTSFSEKMDPQELSQMLNQYFTPMSKSIFEVNGTIDKFIGDAIMALFGAPINYPDHAQRACRASLNCIRNLKSINESFKKKGWPEVHIGIGLNTGVMVAGNIGSDQIQSYTVIGDEVNLGSRLEGLTKSYGVQILVSENTYNLAKNEFLMREVDCVRVKGKKIPVKIYELISELKNQTDLQKAFIQSFDQGLKLYQNKNFKEALALFSELKKSHPQDELINIYIQRSQAFLENPPDENWDGVYEFKTK